MNFVKLAFKLLPLMCLFFLVACEKEAKDWEIEYDENIPNFHGEKVQFNKPMAYVVITASDASEGYTPQEIRMGKQLITQRSRKAYETGREIIEVDDNELFKIISSYWVRKDWWTGIFTEDWHIVVFEDSSEIKSYALMNIFLLNSDRPEFDSYVDYGQ